MKVIQYTIQDEVGIHARPAGMLVKEARAFQSGITLEANGKRADARKLMAVMALGVKKGQEVRLTVEGVDEEEAAARLEAFFRENL